MPYIITTKPRCTSCRAGDGEGECLCGDAESRRAVATLDEAQDYAAEMVYDVCWAWYAGRDWTGRKATINAALDAAYALPDEGGTIGPLPGGTVITVARVTDDQLRAAVAYRTEGVYAIPLAEVIDAYNAAQEVV